MAKRSGVLELAVLGLLQESPMHGYELRKRLHAVLGPFRALSYGSLYPALRDLVTRGCITETADRGRAARRQAGADRLPAHRRRQGAPADLLGEAGPAAWEDENFGVHFAFFAQTDSEVRLRILEGRRSRLEERLDTLRTTHAQPPRAPGRLHPRAAAPRPRGRRARGALAERAHRRRAAGRPPGPRLHHPRPHKRPSGPTPA